MSGSVIVHTEPYREPYEALQQELAALQSEREELASRIAWIDQRISVLRNTIKIPNKIKVRRLTR